MTVDYAKAARLNLTFARTTIPPWGDRVSQIIAVLGFRDQSPTAVAFADAVYAWQKKRGMSDADGVLGPKTWMALEPHSRFCVDLKRPPVDWLSAPADERHDQTSAIETPLSGAIPVALGASTVVRIPVPGTNGLAIEFLPRNFKGTSTSTIFIQGASGKKHLRLDYGYNIKTKSINYHWNQSGTHSNFGITDHATVGRSGKLAYGAAKYFRYAGRALVVVGAVVDAYSVVKADKPLRRATAVVTAWAVAWAGCKVVGAGGALVGSAATPGLGTVAGGVAGCIIGGIGGYVGGEMVGEAVYDWAAGTVFRPLDEIKPMP